jgi:deoxyribonuclease-4
MHTKPEKATPKSPAGLLLGAHLSIAGGLEKAAYRAQALGCTALQVFTKNASTWKERILSPDEIDRFRGACSETGLACVVSHASYLINLASPGPEKHRRSCRALEKELVRCADLGIPYVVLHPGAHMEDSATAGIGRIAASINRLSAEVHRKGPRLLLETTAGQGTSLGHRFEQLAELLDRIEASERIGVCLDSSHVFAAGYDLRTPTAFRRTLTAFERVVGLQRLYLLHLNDSKKALGSRVDRHEHIGLGCIGPAGFAGFMQDRRLAHIPKIIETPKQRAGRDWDPVNLRRLRELAAGGGQTT